MNHANAALFSLIALSAGWSAQAQAWSVRNLTYSGIIDTALTAGTPPPVQSRFRPLAPGTCEVSFEITEYTTGDSLVGVSTSSTPRAAFVSLSRGTVFGASGLQAFDGDRETIDVDFDARTRQPLRAIFTYAGELGSPQAAQVQFRNVCAQLTLKAPN